MTEGTITVADRLWISLEWSASLLVYCWMVELLEHGANGVWIILFDRTLHGANGALIILLNG